MSHHLPSCHRISPGARQGLVELLGSPFPAPLPLPAAAGLPLGLLCRRCEPRSAEPCGGTGLGKTSWLPGRALFSLPSLCSWLTPLCPRCQGARPLSDPLFTLQPGCKPSSSKQWFTQLQTGDKLSLPAETDECCCICVREEPQRRCCSRLRFLGPAAFPATHAASAWSCPTS